MSLRWKWQPRQDDPPQLQCGVLNFDPCRSYVVLVAMGGALFGLEISNISHAHVLMCEGIFKETCGTENPSYSFYAGLITSCVTIGCFFGTCTSGYVQDRFGRKMTVVVACLIYSCGVVIEFVSQTYGTFIAGRIVVGIGAGWFASTVPLYIAELSPSSIRGRLVTSNQVRELVAVAALLVSFAGSFLEKFGFVVEFDGCSLTSASASSSATS